MSLRFVQRAMDSSGTSYTLPSTDVGNLNMQVATSPTELTSPYGDTYRGIFSAFNKKEIAKEDWVRQEQQNINAYLRDIEQMKMANEFTASENEKQRAFDREMASTEYQRAIDDLQKAGLNPILAYSQGGNSTPTHSPATSSSTPTGRSQSNYKGGDSSDFLAKVLGVALMFAGKFVSNPKVTRSIVRGFGK